MTSRLASRILPALGCLVALAIPAASSASTPAEGPIPPAAVGSASLGAGHGCAITTAGTLRCWGNNAFGQLGDGTTAARPAPVEIPVFASQVATGAAHTCVLSGGAVSCWGRNTNGQLGDGTTTSRATPAPVAGLESTFVQAIAAGRDHTCAVISFGAIRCWGLNSRGQLGDGTTVDRSSPVAVIGTARSLAGGAEHTCARTFGDTVRCWGRNSEGQLGDGTTTDRLTPVDVLEGQVLGGVLALSAGGFHNCVADQFGGIKCWGSNSNGQVGDGTTIDRSMATYPVSLGADMVAVAAGTYHSCGVRRDGTTFCWGFNQAGQLGDGTQAQRLVPVEVGGIGQGGAAVLAGDDHSCVLTRLDGLMCMGGNGLGQLGDGGFTNRPWPANVAGLAGVATIRAGFKHNCVVTRGGNLACWGDNAFGQVGDGTTTARDVPKMLDGYNGAVLSLGSTHACTANLCWGENGAGQFGNGTTTGSGIPSFQAQFANIADMAAGELSTCSLSKLGAVQCWGNNGFGQVGDSTNTSRLSPVTVSGLASGVAGLASGSYHACAVTQSGGVKCWGSGSSGELGNGGTAGSNVPVDVTGLPSGVSAVAVGATFSCALTTAGGVKCWGTGNVVGGFGLTQATPVDIPGLASGVTALSAGRLHACARLLTGEVKCWGANAFGQVGDGTTDPRNAPVSVAGIGTGAGVIAAGAEHTCVLMLSGTVKCWGRNLEGRLGDGTTTQRLTPVHAIVTLAVARTGNGTVVTVPPTINCGATCTADVPFGGFIRLIALPAATTTFSGWSGGACFGTAPCDLTVYRPTTVGADFAAVVLARSDFNGDGRTDLLWSNTASGATYVWFMNGPVLISDAFVAQIDPSWKVQGVADFNGDGKPDIVWRNTANGNTYVWYMDGPNLLSDAFVFALPPEWVIQGVADFNADGKPDFLMRNVNSGNAFAWFFDNNVAIGDQFLFNIDPSWKVEQVGDIDLDGQPDLLFRSLASGLSFAWHTQYSGGTLSLGTSTPMIYSIDPVWEVVQLADWNADGKPDLVFRNAATGLVFVWYLDGVTLGGSDYVIQIDPSWEIVPRP
ncbi:MAG: FG-GAP-like repeat-containing protein [Burkholderiales bacterium]